MGTSNVYRYIDSKEDLLASIMDLFEAKTSEAYNHVIQADSSPTEKLDALTWININLLHSYREEFRIQLSWFATGPDLLEIGEFPRRRQQHIVALVEDGLRLGEIRSEFRQLESPLDDLLALCVRDVIWLPLRVVEKGGTRAALKNSRANTLRGAATNRRLAGTSSFTSH
jgi:AcrR family transcriptional regulator